MSPLFVGISVIVNIAPRHEAEVPSLKICRYPHGYISNTFWAAAPSSETKKNTTT